MGKINTLFLEIEQMLDKGERPINIATFLDVPLAWVYEVMDDSNGVDIPDQEYAE